MANPYLVWDVSATSGQTLDVKLEGVASYVWLMKPEQFVLFEVGHNVQAWGGYTDRTPFQIAVPSTGKWKLVVKPAVSGTVRAWVRLF